jgi:uncharacterized protein (TIGR00369 family)
MGQDLFTYDRKAWVHLNGQNIPYPFQNHIRYLPKEEKMECVMGLLRVYKAQLSDYTPKTFFDWILYNFGVGISDLFMIPYNKNILWRACQWQKQIHLKQVIEVVNSCPYYRLLGMEVKEIKQGESRIEMPFKQDLTHPYGIAHGGAIASLADSAVAMALIDLVDPKDRIATIEFKINFLEPAYGDTLICRSRILREMVVPLSRLWFQRKRWSKRRRSPERMELKSGCGWRRIN